MKHKLAIAVLSTLFMLTISCDRTDYSALHHASEIYASYPDSAISLLKEYDRFSMNKSESALYALVYTMSQDKKGMNVSHDSLIRIAYNYYRKYPSDAMYSRCCYYMAKYYKLVDSTKLAERLFYISAETANATGDHKTVCLALNKLCEMLKPHDPKKALMYADSILHIVDKYNDEDKSNIVYDYLNKGECLMMLSRFANADTIYDDALKVAISSGSNDLMADVYQDISILHYVLCQYDSALYYAKLSKRLCTHYDMSKDLELASCYVACDSSEIAYMLLDTIISHGNSITVYSVYYEKLLMAISRRDTDNIRPLVDSTLKSIERMYSEERKTVDDYCVSIISKETENMRLSETNTYMTAIFVVCIFFILSLLIVYILVSRSRQKAAQRIHDAELRTRESQHIHAMEMQRAEREHQDAMRAIEISNRDRQIEMMKNFLISKIEVLDKLESSKNRRSGKVILEHQDWNEIEMFLETTDHMFVTRLKERFPELSVKDMHLFMLLKLNIPNNVLAQIYGISEKSIKQKLFLYKAKVGITDGDASLRSFILSF